MGVLCKNLPPSHWSPPGAQCVSACVHVASFLILGVGSFSWLWCENLVLVGRSWFLIVHLDWACAPLQRVPFFHFSHIISSYQQLLFLLTVLHPYCKYLYLVYLVCFLQQSQGSDGSGGLTTVECCDCTADLVQVCWSCCSWVQGGSPGRIVLVDFCSSILVFNRWWLYRMLLVLGFLNSWQGTLVLGPFQSRTAPQKSRASESCALDSGCLPGCPTTAPPLLISHCFVRIVFYPLTGEVLLVFCVTVLTVGGVKLWSKAAALPRCLCAWDPVAGSPVPTICPYLSSALLLSLSVLLSVLVESLILLLWLYLFPIIEDYFIEIPFQYLIYLQSNEKIKKSKESKQIRIFISFKMLFPKNFKNICGYNFWPWSTGGFFQILVDAVNSN